MIEKERTIRIAFIGLLVFAGVITLLCLTSLLRGSEPAREAKHLLGRFQFVPPEPKDAKKPDPREKYLSGNNIFTPPKKPWSSSRLVGVLGEWAFFEKGSGLKVGEKHKGAKITAIGPDWVELDVDGKPQKVYVTPGGASSGPAPSGRPRMRGGPPSGPTAGPPPGFKVTPEMMERFKKLPPEIRAKAMQNMPPQIREQLQKAM